MNGNIPDLPESLRKRVLTGIRQGERRRARIHLFTSAGIAAASSVGVFAAFIHLAQGLSQSGFWSYVSLLTTDTDIVLANSQAFLFSIAETLPILGIIVLLTATLLLLGAVRVFAISIRNSFIPSLGNA